MVWVSEIQVTNESFLCETQQQKKDFLIFSTSYFNFIQQKVEKYTKK